MRCSTHFPAEELSDILLGQRWLFNASPERLPTESQGFQKSLFIMKKRKIEYFLMDYLLCIVGMMNTCLYIIMYRSPHSTEHQPEAISNPFSGTVRRKAH